MKETSPKSNNGTILDINESFKILDLGSGSGCLGLSLLDEYQNSEDSFFDTSKNSLEVVKLDDENQEIE